MMQPRFERRFGSGPRSLVEQPRYRAGYDFLKLRAEAGEIGADLPEWWEDFALGGDEEREAMIAAAREAQPRSPRRVPGPRSAVRAAGAPGAADSQPAPAAEDADAAPRKRRRRRRKPAGANAEDSGNGHAESTPDAA